MRSRIRWLLVLIPVGLGLFVHRDTIRYALCGFDTYPLIIASRVQSWADFKGTFTEVMMDGRYPGGKFYRPTQNLVLAVEYGLWGLRADGYQVTTLLLFGVCIVLLFVVLRRLMGPAAWIGPLIAAIYYALHPSLLMVLPVVARRVELLVLASWLLALVVLPLGTQQGRAWRAIVAGVLITLAAGSKEIGVLGVGLVFLHQLLFGYEKSPVESLRRAALASIPATVGVALYLLNRWQVIHGWGGHEGTKVVAWWPNLLTYAPKFAASVLCPWSFLPYGDSTVWTTSALAILLSASCYALARAFVFKNRGSPHYARMIVFGWSWTLVNVAFDGLAGTFNPRYVMMCMTGIAIVLAGLIECFATAWRKPEAVGAVKKVGPRLVSQVSACCGWVVTAFVVALGLQVSPLFVRYWEWPEATRQEDQFLAELEHRIREARAGTTIEAPRMPHMPEQADATRPSISVAAMLADYSVQAWADLLFPDRHVRVERANKRRIAPARPDEVVVIVRYERAAVGHFPGQIRSGDEGAP